MNQSNPIRLRWLVAVAVCLLVVAIPILAIELLTDDEPELRVAETGDRFSALLVTENSRLLLVNAHDRSQARALLGRLARPWEPGPSTILAPASEQFAPGVWEVLQRTEPQQLIVTGLPGANPTWHAIEQLCRKRDIRIDYVSSTSTIEGTSLTISLVVRERESSPRHTVVIERSGLTVAIPFSDTAPVTAGNVLISNGSAPAESPSTVLIRGSGQSPSHSGATVVAGDREVIRVVLERNRMRIRGGTLIENREQRATPEPSGAGS